MKTIGLTISIAILLMMIWVLNQPDHKAVHLEKQRSKKENYYQKGESVSFVMEIPSQLLPYQIISKEEIAGYGGLLSGGTDTTEMLIKLSDDTLIQRSKKHIPYYGHRMDGWTILMRGEKWVKLEKDGYFEWFHKAK